MGTEYVILKRGGVELALYGRFSFNADGPANMGCVDVGGLSPDDLLEMAVAMLRPCMWNVVDPAAWGRHATERITKALIAEGARIP